MKRHLLYELVNAIHAEEIRKKIFSVAQIVIGWGETGWNDTEQIIPHLHHSKATFHTFKEIFSIIVFCITITR